MNINQFRVTKAAKKEKRTMDSLQQKKDQFKIMMRWYFYLLIIEIIRTPRKLMIVSIELLKMKKSLILLLILHLNLIYKKVILINKLTLRSSLRLYRVITSLLSSLLSASLRRKKRNRNILLMILMSRILFCCSIQIFLNRVFKMNIFWKILKFKKT